MIKRVAFLLFLVAGLAPLASAQGDNEHLQAGVFGDYLYVGQTHTSFAGVGAQVSVQAYRELKFEGSVGYDFDQAFNEGFTDTGTGTITLQRTGMRIIHGEFGPRLNLGHHRIQPFVTLKGGFMDFRINNEPATVAGFISSISGLRANNVNGVFYPGGGLQGHLGPLGLRLDVGDEMYLNHGTHNGLRVAFGPVIRF